MFSDVGKGSLFSAVVLICCSQLSGRVDCFQMSGRFDCFDMSMKGFCFQMSERVVCSQMSGRLRDEKQLQYQGLGDCPCPQGLSQKRND